MRYFGIRKPDGTIWWIADSEHNAWMSFFQFPGPDGRTTMHRLAMAEAIEAYTAIGYECVELEVTPK